MQKLKATEENAGTYPDEAFLSLFAHELRNPLFSIRNAAHLLKLVSQEPTEQQKHLHEIIGRQVEHMTKIIDDVQDFTRLNLGQVSLNFESCDICAIVREATESYRPRLDSHTLTLVIDIPDKPLKVQGDASRLVQIIDHLLSNAQKFTNNTGTINVSVKEQDLAYVSIIISDTGIGMEPDVISNIFDRSKFPHSTENQKGLGLGLGLVHNLVTLHKGKISAISAGKNQGTSINIQLPLERNS